MALEIERKFLVATTQWQGLATGTLYRQGYLCHDRLRTVRVRIAGDRGFLTIKGPTQGSARAEYEYEIPRKDAEEMLNTLCVPPLIEKKRYCIKYQGNIWEVDEFLASNQGLVVAEIELSHERQPFSPPSWLGREVTGESRFYNSMLAQYPYSQWTQEEKK